MEGSEPPAPPPYSIATVTWRSAEALGALVESMNSHLRSEPELVVVENVSGEDPSAIANGWRGASRTIVLTKAGGFGAAANRAVAECRGEVVVLLNPDTELIDGSLGELASRAARERGLIGPRLQNPDGTPQPSASGPPTGVWPWVGALVPGAFAPGFIQAKTEPWRLLKTTRVSWLTGACIAGQRELLLSLGPFDPAIELYAEDMDLGLRAGAAGIPSLFCPELCSVVHRGGASTSQVFEAQGQEAIKAHMRRSVLRRAYGARAERAAWRALRVNLGLRSLAKRDGSRERLALRATRAATATDLPPLDG
jgi:GT2 family glycosyltransferase